MKIYSALFLLLMAACTQRPSESDDTGAADVRTPVTVTRIIHDTMTDFIELNATSAFLLKSYVKANAGGYLQSGTIRLGQQVKAGKPLFSIKTKEAETIGNAVNALDSTFHFSGVNHIRAGANGYITQLNHLQGDYVQDGEQLAVISDANSFAFLMDMPYELRPYIAGKKNVDVVLPDGETLPGVVASSMPAVDPNAQTQSLVVKVTLPHPIPENLVARIRIIRTVNDHASVLPKSAVLTGETQSEFWIMKLINDSTAVKVPVKKGLQNKNYIEIISPPLSDSDRILLTGNYGLGDTAKIKIVKGQL